MVIGGLIGLGLSWTAPCTIIANIAFNHGISFSSFASWFMNGGQSVGPVLFGAALWNLVIGMVLVFVAMFAVYVGNDKSKDVDPSGQQLRHVLFLCTNPTALLCFWLPKGLWFVGTFLAVFGWKLFKLVHSDRRLLCGLDAAIGAAAGIGFHNPILGALAGGLVSIADYEIVSKRWLKVVTN